ncbi:MAG: serine/threonine protein kinase, partial [Deltaproteobacteria bacterium]|nr:serine/threonine protein kinase [Deltaproteobacteria bacterium]
MNKEREPESLPRSFGNYTLLKLLARGGMGEIYLARTSGLQEFEKYYAVKKLLGKFTKDPDVTTRFVDEAKLGARLGHPNIVQVYDLGRIDDELFMAAEFVDGFDLRRILRFCHEKNKRINLDIALFVVREILSGLAYAHRQVDAQGRPIELVHRDISPQNVLVSFEGEVKIIDFGLAKSTQRSTETQANVLLGNFGYMSPEQARGKKLDVRTDVYSTGVVLFELCTGTKRFVDDNPLSLLEKVANPTPLLPSDRVPAIPAELDRIYQKATAARREDRYNDATEFRDDISHVLHKLNPRSSREHLAEFLNYLFLGGKPPKEPDKDIHGLNQSVSIRLGDLVAGSTAFQTTKEQDAGDRALSEFGDKDPPTQTHAMMRSARMGDKVALHELFKGEPVVTKGARSAPLPSTVATTPVMAAVQVHMPPQPAVILGPALTAPPVELLPESALTPIEELPRASADVTVRAPV